MTKKEKKKKTISVFHGVEHYQQTEKKTFTTKDVDSSGVLQKVLFEEEALGKDFTCSEQSKY